MQDLQKILNWQLLRGSHRFPGPDGGTCINEAAIVAAGFEYKSVRSAKDVPECFCPFLSQLLIRVNDNCSHEDRQKLIPLVLALAGSKTDKDHTKRRVDLFINKFVKLAYNDTEAVLRRNLLNKWFRNIWLVVELSRLKNRANEIALHYDHPVDMSIEWVENLYGITYEPFFYLRVQTYNNKINPTHDGMILKSYLIDEIVETTFQALKIRHNDSPEEQDLELVKQRFEEIKQSANARKITVPHTCRVVMN